MEIHVTEKINRERSIYGRGTYITHRSRECMHA